ncbi:MAG: MBL fold metallo-hydrolase [Candidatus Hydrothermae bacterium]|nr:MBL fold metallo-hydrolase [Candidatus Hydrothermae bacterium]
MKIKVLGAAKTVTGSCYLIEYQNKKILVDCGMFQGHDEHLNYEPFGFEPSELDMVLLTHAHLDHSGRLPKLVREGFEGRILSTSATLDLARIMLLDAAKLQEEEAETTSRRNLRRGMEPVEPLYDVGDAIETISFFGPGVKYDTRLEIYPGLYVTFRDAGHILGSSFLEIEADGKRLIFSGDLGNRDKPIVRDPESPKLHDVDHIFIESTYGNRLHKSIEESKHELLNAIKDTFERGGNVIIPSFAIERAQDLLYFIREFKETGEISRDTKVFLDSPLAIQATKIFRAHRECFDDEANELLKQHKDPFNFPGLVITRNVEASKEINKIESGAIIIAGSGMCTGGRVKHHLKHNLWREECSVIFVGFQAKGTLGREIVDGKDEVEIYGERIKVRAKIYTINGFSAHADRDILLDWLAKTNPRGVVHPVHGEEETINIFEKSINELGYKTYVPNLGETIEI